MMKPVLFAASAFLLLSLASSATFAYSGSECEVNDCSTKSTKANANTAKGPVKAKTKAEVKADVKTAAKSEAKAKALEKAPASVRDVAGFLK